MIMKKIIKLMKTYSAKHGEDITLSLEDDESGEVTTFYGNKRIFTFNSIKELKTKLKE